MNVLVQQQLRNLGLLILVIVLAAVVLLEPNQRHPNKIPSLLLLEPEQIREIIVERPQQETLKFERRSHRWWMLVPKQGWVNPILIDAVLHLGQIRCSLSYLGAELDLKQLQLEPPRLQLWMNEKQIFFGDTAPTDGQRYMQVGNMVYLCPDMFYPLLTSTAGSFLASPLQPSKPTATHSQ